MRWGEPARGKAVPEGRKGSVSFSAKLCCRNKLLQQLQTQLLFTLAPKQEECPNWDMQPWGRDGRTRPCLLKFLLRNGTYYCHSHFISQTKSYGQASHGESAFGRLVMYILFTEEREGRKKSKQLTMAEATTKGMENDWNTAFFPPALMKMSCSKKQSLHFWNSCCLLNLSNIISMYPHSPPSEVPGLAWGPSRVWTRTPKPPLPPAFGKSSFEAPCHLQNEDTPRLPRVVETPYKEALWLNYNTSPNPHLS